MKISGVKTNELAFDAQLQTFRQNIGRHASLLGITDEQVAEQAADALYFHYLLESTNVLVKSAWQWMAWKNMMRLGGDYPPTGLPIPPRLPMAVPGVLPGLESRFRALVHQIKASPHYTRSIGMTLGVETSEMPAATPTVQPAIINASTQPSSP